MSLALAPPLVGPTTDLPTRAKAGDVEAFEDLYRANVGRIHALCLRLTANRALAEELCQEAFVRAWQKLASFRGESAFSSWLHRLTVNVVLSDRRTQRRELLHLLLPMDAAPVPSFHPEGGTAIDLERAIAALPPRARWVFVLHEMEGYDHDEIGRLARISVGTSKAHLHRARSLLREALTP